jgi:hypothetical protein
MEYLLWSSVSQPILDLGNTNNWQPIWNISKASEQMPNKPVGYSLPIEPIVVPFLLENHIIALYAESITAKYRWKLAGKVTKKIATGITVGGAVDTSSSDKRSFYLKEINLFRFTQLTSTYALEIAPMWWLSQINLTLWIYTGVNRDSVTEQLNRIELAVDEINR